MSACPPRQRSRPLRGRGSSLGLRHSISPALIGSTIIAFGPSLPEIVVSTDAAATGNTGIALGNVIGSNISNLLLVLGVSLLLAPATVGSSLDIIAVVLFSAAILPLLLAAPLSSGGGRSSCSSATPPTSPGSSRRFEERGCRKTSKIFVGYTNLIPRRVHLPSSEGEQIWETGNRRRRSRSAAW
ncbi:MAG: hypothetical protein PHP43_10330 [Methanoculleus sp.]|nr:hypothetical protein [Methanoculleus sp.]